MGKSTISMAIFNSKLFVYQGVCYVMLYPPLINLNVNQVICVNSAFLGAWPGRWLFAIIGVHTCLAMSSVQQPPSISLVLRAACRGLPRIPLILLETARNWSIPRFVATQYSGHRKKPGQFWDSSTIPPGFLSFLVFNFTRSWGFWTFRI